MWSGLLILVCCFVGLSFGFRLVMIGWCCVFVVCVRILGSRWVAIRGCWLGFVRVMIVVSFWQYLCLLLRVRLGSYLGFVIALLMVIVYGSFCVMVCVSFVHC